MSTVPARRQTRATRPVNENAVRPTGHATRAADKPASKAAVETKKVSHKTSIPDAVSALASTALSAAAALAKKRKALNDNTNAEKKKALKARKAKEAQKEKEAAVADSAATSVSGPTKLVVELPTRKRRASQASVRPDEAKQAQETVATFKPAAPGGKRKSTGAAKKPKPVEPKPEPVLQVEEPEPKRRRSNDRIAVPEEKPEIVEAVEAVPAKVEDNPFDVGLTKEEEIGMGTATRWDDLDAEDADDPTMVAEYVAEIFEYMKELEIRTMPSPTYMKAQPDLTWEMRGILMDWIIQVHSRFRLLPETLFLATNIIDRFLSLRIVSLIKLQLVGITALFVAAKYEEIMAPSVQNFLKADGYDVQTRTMAKFLVEVSIVEERLIKSTPSMLSAASLWLARLILDREEWNINLEHYSGYSEEELLPCANIMLNYILQPPSAHESLWKKYSGKKYFKCATYARRWAEQRWPPDPKRSSATEGSEEVEAQVEVELAAALPVLREQITARLEEAEAQAEA